MLSHRQGSVFIRAPGPQDSELFLAAVRRSRSLHRPWLSPPDTARDFTAYLDRLALESHYGFLVVHQADEQLVGVINVSNVVRASFQSACLSYYAFRPWAARGLMHQGMLLVIRNAFTRLKLHRLEANVQPNNLRSLGLLRSCGFQREGFSPRYLKIAGRWRDHERWAILRD